MSTNTEKLKLGPVLVAMTNKVDAKDVARLLTEKFGAAVTAVADGDAAWAAVKETVFDAVVVDWKLTKVAGIALVNRLRQDARYVDKPVMVVSELKAKENFTILHDYPFMGLTDGAFSIVAFEIKWDVMLDALRRGLPDRAALARIGAGYGKDTQKARAELEALITEPESALNALYVTAKRLRAQRQTGPAAALLGEALKRAPEHLPTLLEMACAQHEKGEHAAAKGLLDKAQFSKKNTQVLSLQGSIALHELQPAAAKAAFVAALAVDPTMEAAKAGSLVAGNMAPLFEKTAQEAPPKGFLEALERIGTAKTKAAQEQAGIDNFTAALKFAHDGRTEAVILCAIGLAYERLQNKPEAITWLTRAAKVGGQGYTLPKQELARLKAGSAAPLQGAAVTKKGA